MKKVILLIIVIFGLTQMGCDKVQTFPVREQGEPFPCWYMRGLSHVAVKTVKQGNDSGQSILSSQFVPPCNRALAYKACSEIMKTPEGRARFDSEKACNRYMLGEIE